MLFLCGVVSLALHAGVAAPDAPNLFFVSGLTVVGKEGGGESTGSPAELDPLFRFPFAEDTIEEAADETVTAADTVENGDVAGFDDLPFTFDVGDSAPEVVVGIDDLTESGGESGGVGISGFDAFDHFFEVVDFGFDIFTAGFRSLDVQAELEVFFVTDEDVGERSDFGEDRAQFGFAALPEGGAVVEVEADLAAVFLGGAGDFQTEFAGLGGEGGDQTGEVNDLDTFFAEDAFEVKIFDIEFAADFTGAVVLDAGTAAAVTAVGEVELVTETPGVVLFKFGTFVVHVAAGEVVFDHAGDGAAFDESGQNFGLETEVAGDAGDVGFSAGDLHLEVGSTMEGLTIDRGQTDTHTGSDQQRISGIFFEFQSHLLISLI